MADLENARYEQLRPLVNAWLGKMEIARRRRKPWAAAASECMAFFSEPTGFMWDPKFAGKFWKNTVKAPRFQLTIAKAFELVAIFGPTLWNNVPVRTVSPKQLFQLPQALTAPLSQNPMGQQYLQMMQQQLASQRGEAESVAQLLQAWLNYTPGEQPGGGLESHGEMAVTEALIKGRSVLWPRPYRMPGSQRTLTGCFWKSVDDLFIDPDADTLEEAQWMMLRWVQPYWVVEERFHLPPKSLRGSGTLESSHALATRDDDPLAKRSSDEDEADMVEYYEVFSKAGPGARDSGVDSALSDRLERLVGRHAYVVVSPSVPFPLNAPTERVRQAARRSKAEGSRGDAPELAAMFSWPIPTWTDNRWPCCILDFYRKPNSLWPIPPMAPGLGELKFINVFMSHLCNRLWSSTRDFIAIDKRLEKELRRLFETGGDMELLPVNPLTTGPITDNVGFLQQPQVNKDVWTILSAVMEMFDKRVGLTDLLYGLNPGGTNPRTAQEVQAKQQQVSVRPEYMAKKVEHWSSEVAAVEAFCARFFVNGEDIAPLVGPVGRQAWESLVMSTDVESVVRQMRYSVAAGSARRPNKDRDIANTNQFINQFGAALLGYGQQSGDYAPVNAMFQIWGDAADMDVSRLMIGTNGPSPAQQQMMQQQQQLIQQQMAAEQQKAQLKQQAEQMKMTFDQQQHQQEMSQDREEHQQEMQQDIEEHNLQMRMQAGMNRLKQMEAVAKAEQSRSNGRQTA